MINRLVNPDGSFNTLADVAKQYEQERMRTKLAGTGLKLKNLTPSNHPGGGL